MQATALSPFEMLVQATAKDLYSRFAGLTLADTPAALAAMPAEALKVCARALLPRSLEEGLAFSELGWAWADGAGVAEWNETFLSRLASQGRLGTFVHYLRTLREPS